MTEHESTNDAPLSIEAGTLLKNKRESLGMTQKQVADRLRLRVSVIEDIENNQFDSHLVATFIRGYLRSYAKLVSLDEKLVLAALEQSGGAQHQEQEMQSFSRKTKHEKHNSRIMLLTWAIALIILGISAIWWWQNQQENSLAQVVNEASVEEATAAGDMDEIDLLTVDEVIASTPAESVAVTESVANEAADSVADYAAEVPSEPETVSSDAATGQAATQQPTPAESQPDSQTDIPEPQTQQAVTLVPEGMTALTMSFAADCWIQVKDANGKTLVSGTHRLGQKVELAGEAPFKVILGAPEGVTMIFASEPVDLSGYTSGKVARFTLPL
ncbi:cytoskeleton protein RodZ [Vibrio sp. CAU 1672]|uniref:cytoskeleton protein RodZ n=1 Tax=Vibrio sp. CAU 1672 TaxID=3032594 RepID=UPI0023DCA5E1|nr:cytoskeleton protein RodZ [Vibrio sp. CAU 1672]MDF2155565.1 cytoskeleton protein RodZ [Vibrio sp. CAU 1672]